MTYHKQIGKEVLIRCGSAVVEYPVLTGYVTHETTSEVPSTYRSHELTRRDELPCKGSVSDLNTAEAMSLLLQVPEIRSPMDIVLRTRMISCSIDEKMRKTEIRR